MLSLGAGVGRANRGGGGGGGGEGGGGDGGIADIDQTIDRYDYLVAFPHPLDEEAPQEGRRRRGEVRYSQFGGVDTSSLGSWRPRSKLLNTATIMSPPVFHGPFSTSSDYCLLQDSTAAGYGELAAVHEEEGSDDSDDGGVAPGRYQNAKRITLAEVCAP